MALLLMTAVQTVSAQQRRPIDSEHPLWMIHVDVWNKADPQKIIDLIPDDVKPYICINLSLSCQYNKERARYLMPQNAARSYKSWATVCQLNNIWFCCQPASGGHTHLQTSDLETFEYFFKKYPNFLGWNFAEQFWGFDEDALFSAKQTDQIELFANLVEMSHNYGGFLTISFCGNKWSHGLSPVGMLKRNSKLMEACKKYPEAILWLYKYTQSWCFYNAESVCFGPFIGGLAKNYGVRYDNCAWDGVRPGLAQGDNSPYPVAAGIGTVMEQTGMNGGAVWDGPELIWTEDFRNLSNSTVDGYTRRNWGTFDGFRGAWIDMFQKIIDGTLYIPTREEVVEKTKIVVIADKTSGSDEEKYASWGDLYDGVYKQNDKANSGSFMGNRCFFKKTGRYGAIPITPMLYDDLAKKIPVQVKRSNYTSRWGTVTKKTADFNAQYPVVSTGTLYVNRYKNQLVTYWPHTNLHGGLNCTGVIPLEYNTCESLKMTLNTLGSGLVREYSDHIDFYLNNFRTDTTTLVTETIVVAGAKAEPTYKMTKRTLAKANATAEWDAENSTYTLTVKHMGGVDITIYCEGEDTERKTDVVNSAPLSADLPKQPEDYYGEIIIEAEDMDFKNIKSCVTDPYTWYPNVDGHAGNGFADMGTNTAGGLRHQLTLKKGGNYRISVRYMNATKAGILTAVVNGTSKKVQYEKAGFNEWKKVTFDATLKEGKNDLKLTNTSGVALYIDQIYYTPADMEPESFLINIRKGNYGTITADKAEAKEGDIVTVKVTANKGYKLTELRVINGVNYTMGTTINITNYDPETETLTFVMPDDMVTLRPVFGKASAKEALYSLDFSNVNDGTMPQGWRCMQENDEVHEYNNSYSLGARTFAGFIGFQGKGLYWRDNCAEYGRQSNYPLKLTAGSYILTYNMAAWKKTPNFKVQILDSSDHVVAESDIFDATPNADGNKSADLSSAETRELPFDISQAGNYIISFKNTSTFNADYYEFLLMNCVITKREVPNSIKVVNEGTGNSYTIYGAGGEQRSAIKQGFNIIRTSDGRVKKIYQQ